jgi:hypothetical protein
MLDWRLSEERLRAARVNSDQTVVPLPVLGIQSSRSSYEFEVEVEEVVNLLRLV